RRQRRVCFFTGSAAGSSLKRASTRGRKILHQTKTASIRVHNALFIWFSYTKARPVRDGMYTSFDPLPGPQIPRFGTGFGTGSGAAHLRRGHPAMLANTAFEWAAAPERPLRYARTAFKSCLSKSISNGFSIRGLFEVA